MILISVISQAQEFRNPCAPRFAPTRSFWGVELTDHQQDPEEWQLAEQIFEGIRQTQQVLASGRREQLPEVEEKLRRFLRETTTCVGGDGKRAVLHTLPPMWDEVVLRLAVAIRDLQKKVGSVRRISFGEQRALALLLTCIDDRPGILVAQRVAKLQKVKEGIQDPNELNYGLGLIHKAGVSVIVPEDRWHTCIRALR